jgi:N-dimethylarginine dimethylaminohydrolase
MLYHRASDVDFALRDLPAIPRPRRVLLTTPDHFDVLYVINPHMEGNIGAVDRSAAVQQWQALRAAYESLSIPAEVMQGAEGLPDMVFCANQTLPYYDPTDGTRGVVISRMYAPERRDEVPHYERFFRQQGYAITHLPEGSGAAFEGMGDAIWHPGRYLLWGGYGIRTDCAAYDYLTEALGVTVLALELNDPDFYHLDTCFSVLDADTVLIYPGAFTAEGLALIEHVFAQVIEAPEDEARHRFACNAHCPDEEHVFIQQGCETTGRRLRNAGFAPVTLDTSEFIKAGGSVFCMKQMIW